jgi:hypothetical protein
LPKHQGQRPKITDPPLRSAYAMAKRDCGVRVGSVAALPTAMHCADRRKDWRSRSFGAAVFAMPPP